VWQSRSIALALVVSPALLSGVTFLVGCVRAYADEEPVLSAVTESLPHPRAVTAEASCPDGMILIEGAYCPKVEQRCLRWMDPPGRYHDFRCAEYARPATCLADRVQKRFCIDRYERAEEGSGLPLNRMSWLDTKRICEEKGARACMESEWNFACEGEEMRPYPYGWARDAGLCNADHYDLLVPGHPSKILDLRTPASAHPECLSAFGVQGMAGNVAEWVTVDGTLPGSVVVQKGNWWQPGKHACRDAQAGHDKFYYGTETGFRCCKDAPNAPGLSASR
jgi:Sulfatase-modifying factor enzyme 1